MYPGKAILNIVSAQMAQLSLTRSSPTSTSCSRPRIPDYGPNGLQVPGAEEVTLVATGVSAHRELFERAAEAGAQLVLAHHGLFWDFHPRSLSPAMKERLRVLFDNDIALAGYHLPLDAHPEVGNNALICAALGLERAEPFGAHRGRSDRLRRTLGRGIPFDELRRRCAEASARSRSSGTAGPELVRSVGIVSGAARVELRRGDRAGPRRLPHRRARRARDGGRARERHALHRGRPLRHRDVRRAPARRARGGASSASSTASSTLPNPI